jgi:hypothetical protein
MIDLQTARSCSGHVLSVTKWLQISMFFRIAAVGGGWARW